ncbi:MAG TPA: response regulator [Verrucomicrobiae bacterium]|nr:response regulator [Verrucomicrobiae bacterium]
MALTHHHHVLLVEDDEDCRAAVSDLLASEGYTVSVAENGQSALEQLRAGLDPCVVLLDLMMPVKDGWQFRLEQMTDEDLLAIPVIVMSGIGAVREAAQQLGIQDYIEKPVPPERLFELLGRYPCARQ